MMAATEFELLGELEEELEDEQAFEARPEYEWESHAFPESTTEAEAGLIPGCPRPTRATVRGFSRYSNSVASLLPGERAKVNSIATLIVRSFRPGCQPVRTVRLVGHADRDLLRERREPGFMVRISRQRALAVKEALERLINNRAISSRIVWQVHGAGASQLVVPNPATEEARRRNRRVDIAVSTGGVPPDPWAIAVQENRRYMRSLGWQAYTSAIMRLMGFIAYRPSEAAIASAVARWQRQRGLVPNGIIGPQTLERIRASLQSLQSFAGETSRPTMSMQEIPPDPGVLRKLQREFQSEAGDEADKFVTEQIAGIPAGHKHLTALATSGLPVTSRDLDALKDGNARVDDIAKAFEPDEQKRHVLRKTKCQPVADALSDARNHLIFLHSLALGAPVRQTQFEWLGEALHLIQDSYSNAHTERVAAGGRLPIVFIRFFGFQGSCKFPIEHRVVPPPDPRDCITAGCIPKGTLTVWARESISASREYLVMALRHIASPGSPTISIDLRAFMDRHLILHPSHTPTTKFYPRCPDPNAPCSP
jgi:outer membrane protein OmpA-like peptidoglycan-associated protein